MITIQKPPFPYDALEPYIDAKTMEIHTEKHHQTYADKLNMTLRDYPEWQDRTLDELLMHLRDLPDDAQTPVKNFAGGVANHDFFWTILSPESDQPVPDVIGKVLTEKYGNPEKFKQEFGTKAAALFGSGWTWLVSTVSGGLDIVTTQNQDSPRLQGYIPLLGLDVWEHAYYLKYQNRRPDYIDAFWHVVNWQEVNRLYQNTLAKATA